MTHPERVEDYLEHIVQAIDRATRYIQPLKDAAARQRTDARRRRQEYRNYRRSCRKVAPAFVAANAELPWLEMRGEGGGGVPEGE